LVLTGSVVEGLLAATPRTLVDDRARQRVRAAVERLPTLGADRVGLEVRLGADPRVDLLVLVATPQQLTHLAAVAPRAGWDCAVRLARRALPANRHRPDLSPAIWLEFDLVDDEGPAAPGVFVTVAPEPGEPADPPQRAAETIAEVLSTVSPGSAMDRRVLDAVTPIVRSGLIVQSVGWFPGRTGTAIRLFCRTSSTTGGLLDVVDRCGWDGPRDAAARWVELVHAAGGDVHLDLDVTADGLRPEIGVEASYHGRPPTEWVALLAGLERAGMCGPEKREAAVSLATGHADHHLLHHVKVAIDALGAATVKAYVAGRQVRDARCW
jgi:hypothetical protein